jgi:hypothetical protein
MEDQKVKAQGGGFLFSPLGILLYICLFRCLVRILWILRVFVGISMKNCVRHEIARMSQMSGLRNLKDSVF